MIEAETKVGSPGINQVPPEYAAMAEVIKNQDEPEDSSNKSRWLRGALFIVSWLVLDYVTDRVDFSLDVAEQWLGYGAIVVFLYHFKLKTLRPKVSESILFTLIIVVGFYLAFWKIPDAAQQWIAFPVAQGLALWVYFVSWKAQDGTREDFLQKKFWKWVGKSLLFATAIAAVVALLRWMMA